MGFNLSDLTAWTDEHKIDLIAKSVLKGRTIDLINLQAGIKNSATINVLSSSPIFQAGACGWNASGSTTISQNDLTVCDIKINESYCLNDLEQYFTSKYLKPGSYNEDLGIEATFAGERASKISELVDLLAWRGGDAGETGNLTLCDGFLKKMKADTSVIDVTGLTFSSSTIVDNIDAVVAAIPSDVIDASDLHIFMGYDMFRKYAKALRDANLFHYTGEENQGGDFTLMVPGTNVRAIAVKGLNGKNFVVATPASNLFVGTDLLSDMEDFKYFYSQDNDEVRNLVKFKIGFGYAFGDFIVLGQN